MEMDAVADGKLATVHALAFGEQDGMRNRECNGASPPGLKARDGKLWFPTLTGVAVIDPAHIPFNRIPPTVMIERARGDQRLHRTGGDVRVTPRKDDLEVHY